MGYAWHVTTTAAQSCIPVSEHHSPSPPKTSGLSWVGQWLQRWIKAPRSKADLVQALLAAQTHRIIDMDSRHMLEGVLWMADKTVADVMVAAPKMDLIDIQAPQDELFDFVIDKAHSRFPVFEAEKENILGILLAKDLLKLQRAPELNIRALLRPAVFVPETKGLNDLLREFRHTRNHQALVVDEFGRVSGLVTIEDVLEEIVGEIEGLFGGDNAPIEKLLTVSSSYGHKGDDAYLVLSTEINTYTLVGNVGRRGWIHDYDHEIRSMHALTAAAKTVLEHPGPRELSRSGLSEVSTNAKTSTSIADEIAKLLKLRDSGALTDEEFQTLKKKLL